ncbi:acyl-CoA dehydrogenase family protein [Brenneria uluponensis]|uniref:acyl-CoA dehydrogenase family protein n=1 Tax=Brenneria uluponensis TaxID=3057057 RepID=UPI0028EA1DE4|nr:acyl-CoA dehydrogenase family protein [Brenneria ulupoensis]
MKLSVPQMALRELALSSLASGRSIGQLIEQDPDNYLATVNYALAPQINRLGLPEKYNPAPLVLSNGDVIYELTVSQRCLFYEALGYVEPNLIFSCPNPGMSGFVLQTIGNAEEQERFFSHFRQRLCWSCFAMSEPMHGTDASEMTTRAIKVDGGWLIRGEKYFIGNGINADIGVVFARSNDGPLGINLFLFEPRNVSGFSATRLPVLGVPGSNISHLVFDDMWLDDDALIGQHLRPVQRFSAAAMNTFDSLRPCVGSLSLGVARAIVDHVQQAGLLTPSRHREWLQQAQRRLAAALGQLIHCTERVDRGETISRQIGLAKAMATSTAESVAEQAVHRCEAGAVLFDPQLRKLMRDIKGFEYTEGTRNIHFLNACGVFRENKING